MKTKSNLPARPTWTGFLKVSMVTCGVRLYTATTDADRIKFNRIHGPSGERVRQPYQVPGIGEIDSKDVVSGYEYAKGEYLTFEPDELRSLRLDSTDVIEVTDTVSEIDPVYYDTPYFLLAEGGASEQGYNLIWQALRNSGMIAIGQVVICQIERIVAIRATANGLLVNTLRYADELRPADQYYPAAPLPSDPEEVAMMETILGRKFAAFDPAKYVDRYDVAVRALIEQRLAGVAPTAAAAVARPPQVNNLMAALKASLKAEGAPAPKKRSRKKPALV